MTSAPRAETGTKSDPPRRGVASAPPRRPLVPLFLASASGIVADAAAPAALWAWLVLSTSALMVFYLRRSRLRSTKGTVLLLLATAGLPGAWHHYRVRWSPENDVARGASVDGSIARLRGTVVDGPYRKPRDLEVVDVARMGLLEEDASEPVSSRFELAVQERRVGSHWSPAGGVVAVHVFGPLDHVRPGQRVEAIGLLSLPFPIRNPGEFDYGQWLRSRGIGAILRVESPEGVAPLSPISWWRATWPIESFRRWAEKTLASALPPTEAGLAQALILGSRGGLSRQQITPYLEGGTIHLLVVSGLQVGVLAGLAWWASGLFARSLGSRGALTGAVVVAYALLTGADPPVLRAAFVVLVALGGFFVGRTADPINSLAAAGLAVLALGPADLFHAGPQLSFACVLIIVLFGRMVSPELEAWLEPSSLSAPSPARKRSAAATAVEALLVSLVVWILTAPLVVYHFHLFAPISVLVSAIMIPTTMLSLSLVGILLAVAAVAPWATFLPATACVWLLSVLDQVVVQSSRLPGAFFYSPSLPRWWVLGFYLLLLVPAVLAVRGAARRASLAGLVAWIAIGGGWIALRRTPLCLEYHQLAVGHGNCSVLRTAEGGTILYDCGSLRAPTVAERSVAPWLWQHHVGAIDAVFISHADVDHFNGLLDLARRFPIGKAYVTPQFLRSSQPEVVALCLGLLERGVPIEPVWAGDLLRTGEVTLRILQPNPRDRSRGDNADSMVVLVESGGWRMLWTGDLDGEGLAALLSTPPTWVDVLIAPHHGAAASNPPELARWSAPRLVLSTQSAPRLASVPSPAYDRFGGLLLRTDVHGTISVYFERDELAAKTFRTGIHWRYVPFASTSANGRDPPRNRAAAARPRRPWTRPRAAGNERG